MRHRMAIVLSLVALVAVACGDDAALITTTTTTTVAATTTTTVPATTTTAPPTTTTATTSTTTTSTTTTAATTTTTTTMATTTTGEPVSRCASLTSMNLPADADTLNQLPGNFDGEPQPLSIMHADSAILFRSGGAYYIGFYLYIDYLVYIPLPVSGNPTFVPELHSVRDFGDLDDGALVMIDRAMAASEDVYAFFFLDGACHVVEAGTATEPHLEFLVGFGASHREGLTCGSDRVFATAAGASGTPGQWSVSSSDYIWDPTGFGFIAGPSSIRLAPESDPDVLAAGALTC